MKFEYNVTAKTVEEAYKKAREMYSSLGELSYEIVNSGKKGLFGLFGSVPAEIKVVVDDGKPEPKQKPQPKPVNKEVKENKPAQKQTHGAEKSHTPVEKKEEKKEEKPQKSQKPAHNEQVTREPIKDEDIHVNANEKQVVIDFLTNFVKNIGYDCTVSGDMTPDENGYVSRVVTIEGESAANLIGHHGETLDSLQYLANLCLARKCEGEHKEYVKVIVDIENYRAKREETLRALARRMGDKAIKYKRNVLLEPMNPYERRIIHSEIQKIEGISTHSVGYDENRKIVITYEGKK